MVFGIVGLGLMGGSFALALKQNGVAKEVYGYDHNEEHQKQALEIGFVDKIVDFNELKNVDVIILAIPVDGIIACAKDLKDISKNTTIIDLGSTKEKIVNNIPDEIKSNFIPAHPMTGTEKFGPKAAIDRLYDDKIVVLCDLEVCGDIHVSRAKDIFERINMNIVYMNSKEHDIHACYMSHLPHAISFSLANSVMDHESPKEIITLAAGGFKDMSRIAKSSPAMWHDIFRQNKKNLLESIDIFENHMARMRKMIEEDDYESLKKWMTKANTLHDIL